MGKKADKTMRPDKSGRDEKKKRDDNETVGRTGANEDGGPPEEEYVVEEIIDKRFGVGGRVEYFLKWVGYDHRENTWEPSSNLTCPQLVEAFEKKRRAEEAKKNEEKTVERKRRPRSESEEDQDKHIFKVPFSKAAASTSTRKAATTNSPTATSGVADAATSSAADAATSSASLNSSMTSSSATRRSPPPPRRDPRADMTGFERGFEAEKIIAATNSSGELKFLMKWKETDEADLVPARQANVLCPQVVIAFYEENMKWHIDES